MDKPESGERNYSLSRLWVSIPDRDFSGFQHGIPKPPKGWDEFQSLIGILVDFSLPYPCLGIDMGTTGFQSLIGILVDFSQEY